MSDKSKDTQFGQGRNMPNRKGRPKGSPNMKTLVRGFAQQMHKVSNQGKGEELNTVMLLLRVLTQEALKGNVRAVKMRDKFLKKYMVFSSQQKEVVMAIPIELSPEEWVRKMEQKSQNMERIMHEELAKEAKKKAPN